MRDSRALALLTTCLLLSFSGCGSKDDTGQEEENGEDLTGCSVSADCEPSEVCEEDLCVFVPIGSACESDEECGNGAFCADHLPGGYCTVTCEASDDCPSGSACVVQGGEGICRAECEDHDDCRDEYVCTAGTCFLPCESDEECDGGEVCIEGVCDGAGVGLPCTGSGDCEGDLQCALPERGGYCTTACGGDEDCPVGSVCGNLFGEDTCLAACRAAEDCREGEICHDGGCLPVCTEADCPEGHYCDDSGLCRQEAQTGRTVIELGEASEGTQLEFDIPEGTHSFMLVVHGSTQNTYGFTSLVDPDGSERITGTLDMGFGMGVLTDPHRTMPRTEINTTQVPISDLPGMEMMAGTWSFAFDGGSANASVVLKEGGGEHGSVPLNVFVSPDAFPGYDASNLETSSHFQGVLDEWDHFFVDQANVTISEINYFDLPAQFNDLEIDMMSGMMGYEELFSSYGRDDGLNAFFIRSISMGFLGDGVAGISGGIPGPARIGETHHSGIVIATQDQPRFTGLVFCHEAGHFHGLFHVSEQNLFGGTQIHDILSDTPQCAPGSDPCTESKKHLMFPTLEPEMDLLSPASGMVIRANVGVD